MELDLKHVMYLIIGMVLVAALGTFIAKPIYTRISGTTAGIQAIDFTNTAGNIDSTIH